MPTIEALAEQYLANKPTSIFLDNVDGVCRFFIEAVNEYQAWAALDQENQAWQESANGGLGALISSNATIDKDSEITLQEWGIIKPLAHLYLEREQALIQEASKNHMLEQFGRTSSEIEQDIVTYRNDQLRHLSFHIPIMTI